MARSHYKARGMGKLPPCAICMGPGYGGRATLHLPFGVSVWLCAEHRSAEFLTRRAGRDLVASLGGVWQAAGCMTSSRDRALRHHLRRIGPPSTETRRPGSYSWPELRREAEARFARGERPPEVIRHLRDRHGGDAATVPSVRTMQRWFSEGRWLDGGIGPGPAGGGGPSDGPAADPGPAPTVPVQGRTDDEREGSMDTALTTWTARRRQEGFTFVELLVAMIVVGLLAAVMIPVVLGQREKAHGAGAESLLRNGASTMEAASVDTQGYALVTTDLLAQAEPNVAWLSVPGASAPANEVSVSGLGPMGYTLSTTSASGTVYVFEKDLTAQPTVTRTCGPGCTW